MKEVMIFVRYNKVGVTRLALEKAGFPAYSCKKVLGRGKKSIPTQILKNTDSEVTGTVLSESDMESYRLIPKRVFSLIVNDDDVKPIVEVVMQANSTGNPGDGKIFVLPLDSAYRVRDGKLQTSSENY